MRHSVVILLMAWLAAVVVTWMVTVLHSVHVRCLDLAMVRLRKIDDALKEDNVLWAVDLLIAVDGKIVSQDVVHDHIALYESDLQRLNSHVKRFLIPQLNFVRPAARASRKYVHQVRKIYKQRHEPDVRGLENAEQVQNLLFAQTKEYRTALRHVQKKLDILQKTSFRLLIGSVVFLTFFIVVIVVALLHLGQSILSFLRLMWQRHRPRRRFIPAYIIKGRLFVDRNSVNDDESVLLPSDDSFDDDDPEAPPGRHLTELPQRNPKFRHRRTPEGLG